MSFAASRWVSVGLLMNEEEWKQFFNAFPSLRLYVVSAIVDEGKEEMSSSDFLETIRAFTRLIQETSEIDLAPFRIPFSVALSPQKSDFSLQSLSVRRCLLKPAQPVIQLRPLSISLGPEGSIQTKSWGKENIVWGIQLSYPQIFQDPATKEIIQALSGHPNGKLFKEILKWLRSHTKPVFLKGKEKTAAFSLKVGEKSIYLLSNHQQLKKNHLEFTI